MWRLVVNRMLLGLVFQQALITLTIGLQQGWIRSIACVPPVGLVILFKITLSRKFDARYTWMMPTDQEVATAIVHKSDARKNRLHKRFGNPALTSELFTPMIHKNSQHLLRQIYSGRMAEDDYIRQYDTEVKGGSAAQTGGLNFKAVGERDLAQSREAYLREQDAWETGSVSTAAADDATPLYRTDAAQNLFESKKREYLAGGRSRPETPGVYDIPGAPALPPHAYESQDNLLQHHSNFRATPGLDERQFYNYPIDNTRQGAQGYFPPGAGAPYMSPAPSYQSPQYPPAERMSPVQYSPEQTRNTQHSPHNGYGR